MLGTLFCFGLGAMVGWVSTLTIIDFGDDPVATAALLPGYLAQLHLVVIVIGLLTAMSILFWGDGLRPGRTPLLLLLAVCGLAIAFRHLIPPAAQGGPWDLVLLFAVGPVVSWIVGMLGLNLVLRVMEPPSQSGEDSRGQVGLS